MKASQLISQFILTVVELQKEHVPAERERLTRTYESLAEQINTVLPQTESDTHEGEDCEDIDNLRALAIQIVETKSKGMTFHADGNVTHKRSNREADWGLFLNGGQVWFAIKGKNAIGSGAHPISSAWDAHDLASDYFNAKDLRESVAHRMKVSFTQVLLQYPIEGEPGIGGLPTHKDHAEKFVALDSASGGYPYSVEIGRAHDFKTEAAAEKYRTHFDKFVIRVVTVTYEYEA